MNLDDAEYPGKITGDQLVNASGVDTSYTVQHNQHLLLISQQVAFYLIHIIHIKLVLNISDYD